MSKIFADYKNITGIKEVKLSSGLANLPFNFRSKFSVVHHISHIPDAKLILDTNRILPQLIQDKSILNSERVQVIWLSPNVWNDGSLYGNIRFSFDFQELIQNKRFYAVEVMDEYKPIAFRILISEVDYSGNKLYEKYDPTILNNGPWYFDVSENTHYYNSNYNIEFMFEGILLINNARSIDFVNHHPSLCNIYGADNCPYRRYKNTDARNIFLSYLVSTNIQLPNLELHKSKDETVWPLLDIASSYESIANLITNEIFEGTIPLKDQTGEQLSRAILWMLGRKEIDAANKLSRLYNSREAAISHLRKLFASYFMVDESMLSSNDIVRK